MTFPEVPNISRSDEGAACQKKKRESDVLASKLLWQISQYLKPKEDDQFSNSWMAEETV
jgi:hypothetical protein